MTPRVTKVVLATAWTLVIGVLIVQTLRLGYAAVKSLLFVRSLRTAVARGPSITGFEDSLAWWTVPAGTVADDGLGPHSTVEVTYIIADDCEPCSRQASEWADLLSRAARPLRQITLVATGEGLGTANDVVAVLNRYRISSRVRRVPNLVAFELFTGVIEVPNMVISKKGQVLVVASGVLSKADLEAVERQLQAEPPPARPLFIVGRDLLPMEPPRSGNTSASGSKLLLR